jgi:hypothetical protein
MRGRRVNTFRYETKDELLNRGNVVHYYRIEKSELEFFVELLPEHYLLRY